MEISVKFSGKFYMRTGVVIEEEVVFDKDNDMKVVEQTIKDIQRLIKEGFRDGDEFQVTFGRTIFRGKDICAVSFAVDDSGMAKL